MQRRSKQKSCFACANGKRRCDRTLPSCNRCRDRGTKCVYPKPLERSDHSLFESAIMDLRQDNFQSSAPDLMSFDHGNPSTAVSATIPRTMCDDQDPSAATSEATGYSASLHIPSLYSTAGTSKSDSSNDGSNNIATQSPSSRDVRWFMPPMTWKVAYHFQPPPSLPAPQIFLDFIRGLHTWVVRFQQDGHAPFIHRHLYPAREIPLCIQDAYAAIAVSEGSSASNENLIESILYSYATKLIAQNTAVVEQPPRLVTAKDQLARTQALLIHLVLALSSSSISRQTKADRLVETLHRWKVELLETAEQEASVAQLIPCASSLYTVSSDANVDPYPDLYRAFVICESIRRTWLLCSVTIGVYRSIKGDWTSTCGGDICFTARGSLWNAMSSAAWADIARNENSLFMYSLHGKQLVKQGVLARDVDEFAIHLFRVMWGPDKVESWMFCTEKHKSTEQ